MTDTDMLYVAGLEARIQELEEKHHNECGQIAHYSDELRKAKDLLREALPVLKVAFFANFKDKNAADELFDKIKAAVGGTE